MVEHSLKILTSEEKATKKKRKKKAHTCWNQGLRVTTACTLMFVNYRG